MKPLSIAGLVVVLVGVVILFRGLSYDSQRTVMRVGDMHITAEEHRGLPVWVGGAAIVGGALLIGAGLRGRRIV